MAILGDPNLIILGDRLKILFKKILNKMNQQAAWTHFPEVIKY